MQETMDTECDQQFSMALPCPVILFSSSAGADATKAIFQHHKFFMYESFSIHRTNSLDSHTRTVISCEHHRASSANFQCGHTLAQCSTFIPSRDVFVRRPVSSVPSRFVFAFGSVIKTFQRPPHPLQEQPKRARSLEWVWPDGCISTKHRFMSPSSPTSSATWIRTTPPFNIADNHHNFLCLDDATMIATSPDGLPISEASSSSRQAAVGRVSSPSEFLVSGNRV